MEYDGAPQELIEAIAELIDNLKVTAMEAGELCDKIIKEQGWEEQFKEGWA